MTAAETVTAEAQAFYLELARVRREYDAQPLDALRRLMARTFTDNPNDALREEARQRIGRREWAAVTSRTAP